MKVELIDNRVRRTMQYQEGVDAYTRELRPEDCPYKTGKKKLSWLCGWYDSRTTDRLGHIFKKYKIAWP